MAKFKQTSNQKIRANAQIKAPQIRLIGADGEQLGIVSPLEGMKIAREQGLDLVEVAGNVSPPVCRILDRGKYVYSLAKKEKESRKNNKTYSIKEIKMTSKIEEHDYQTKLRNARRFLDRGDKVKLTLFFRGREITHRDIGDKIVARFIEDLDEVGEVERNDGLEGNAIHVYFMKASAGAKKTKKAAKKEEQDA